MTAVVVVVVARVPLVVQRLLVGVLLVAVRAGAANALPGVLVFAFGGEAGPPTASVLGLVRVIVFAATQPLAPQTLNVGFARDLIRVLKLGERLGLLGESVENVGIQVEVLLTAFLLLLAGKVQVAERAL